MSPIAVSNKDSRQGILFICLSASLWGTVGIVVKQLYQFSEISTLGAGFYRLAFGFPFALLGCLLLRGSKTLKASARDLFMMGSLGLLLAAYLVLYFNALRLIGVAMATLMALCTAPVITALLSILLFGDRVSIKFLLCLAMSVLGTILLVFRPGINLGSHELATGALFSVAAALSYALMVFTSQGLPDKYPSLLPSTVSFGVGGLALLPFILSGGGFPALTIEAWSWFIYLGAVPTAFGYGLFFFAMRTVRPRTAAILTMAEPLVATCLAWLLFSEKLGFRGWVGAILLVGAVWALYTFGQSKNQGGH